MIFAAGIRRLVISTKAKLLGIKLSINQSICNQNATLSAIKSIKSMISVYLDQSIQVELEILIVLLVDNSAREALAEAKFVHFSDWPMPKPWKKASDEQIEMYQPACRNVSMIGQDFTDRDVWPELRSDFSERRQVYDDCSLGKIKTDSF